jgi:hypothetical protein
MKYALFIPFAATLSGSKQHAQSRIYRCGNEYTNNAADAQARGCKLVEGGNITIVRGHPRGQRARSPAPRPVRVANAPQAFQRVDALEAEQRARDNDARAILEAELKKAEARRAELLKEYNNGEPENGARGAQPPEVPGPRGRTQGQHRPQ